MTGFGSHPWAVALLLLLLCGGSASAEQPGDASTAGSGTVIDSTPPELSDPTIQKRIEAIYAQIDTLKNVSVSVQQGVVTLSGQTSNEAQAQRALALANRLEGIVTVEDEIERTLDVEGNVIPIFDEFVARVERWLRAWPLVVLSLLVFVVIAFVGLRLASWAALWNSVAPNIFVAELLAQAVRVLFVILGLVVALNLVGATTLMGTILGGAGVLGLAIGFAVRDSLENYISSVMLSLRQPFRANDHVAINEHEGKVVRLTSRATVLMTLDGNHLRIPNATVYKAVILNYTRNPERRFEFDLGIDAADDPIAAMSTGLEAMGAIDNLIDDPGPTALIKTVGDSTIVITFLAWIDQTKSDFGRMRSLAITVTKNAIEQAGFTLPEPLYRVRLDDTRTRLAGSPLETAAGTQAPVSDRTAPAAPKAASKPPDEAQLDVSPDRHIEEMVNDERSQSAEVDLLDNARPVE